MASALVVLVVLVIPLMSVAWFLGRVRLHDYLILRKGSWKVLNEKTVEELEDWNHRWHHPDTDGDMYDWDIDKLSYFEVKEPLVPTSKTQSRIDLFRLNGVTYSIPSVTPASVYVDYLHNRNTKDEETATYLLLKRVLGDDAYKALANHPSLRKSDLDRIMEVVQDTFR